MRTVCGMCTLLVLLGGCSSSPTTQTPSTPPSDAGTAADVAEGGSAVAEGGLPDAGADGAACVPAACITLPEPGGRCGPNENLAACATNLGPPCAPDPSCKPAKNQVGGDSAYFCCVD
jgi:hypothetical protein